MVDDANEDITSYNGLRDDVASFLAEIEPSFLRFPGGNNLYVPFHKTRKDYCLTRLIFSTGRELHPEIAGNGMKQLVLSLIVPVDKVRFFLPYLVGGYY